MEDEITKGFFDVDDDGKKPTNSEPKGLELEEKTEEILQEEKTKEEKPKKYPKPQKSKSFKKKLLIIMGSIIGVIGLLYFGMTFYFTTHFQFNSTVNGFDVSGKSIAKVEEDLNALESAYVLTLEGRDGKTEKILGKEISLDIHGEGEVETLVKEQNPFAWPASLFNSKKTEMTVTTKYDETLLKSKVSELQMVSGPNIVKAESAKPVYKEGAFEIVEGHEGNKLDDAKLKSAIEKALAAGNQILDLEAEECYEGTNFTVDSPEVIAANKTMNKYLSSAVTYTFGEAKEVLNKEIINTWLSVDDKMQVVINQGMMMTYLNSLSEKYDTYGNTRNFQTSYGSVVSVPGGDYGWLIDTEGEIEELTNIIKNGQAVTREPLYSSKGASRGEKDYGNTYVEISLDGQHMWFYKNGALVVDTDIVTGSLSGGYGTPAGFFGLDYKALDVTLKGEGYASPVTFWMPYDGDIGIHDASWRGSYGGSIYVNDGSHGCVNTPYAAAEMIYSGIEEGDPVVVY